MSAPRILSKKGFLFLVVCLAFGGSMLLNARNMRQLCEEGSYCATSGLRNKIPNFGSNGEAGRESIAFDWIRKGGSKIPPAYKAVALDECALFPNTSGVLTVMKTGASEAYSRIPTQLMTTLKCLPEHFIFSDMKQTIAGYAIHDSLDTIRDDIKQSNVDFELYLRQQKCPTDQGDCNKFFDTAKQGWNLDKYKNIHMAEKAYRMRPDYDWYLFIDADTYVAYPTLMEWLKHLDPHKPHYIGSVAYLGQLPFGHGGSGYLVSQAAMHAMFHGKENVASKWDEAVQKVCCGDAMFSQALKDETGIEVVNAWPVINGEKPHTIPYYDDEWCQPITTMHHVTVQETSDLYAFEKDRNFTQPLRIKDLFHKFVGPTLTASRTDWDNLSDSVYYLNTSLADYAQHELDRAKRDGLSEKEAIAWKSFDDCKNVCLSQDNCFQFRFQNHICATSDRLKHGWPTKQENDDSLRYMSGWNVEKIAKWIKEKGECGEQFKWPVKDTWT
ncbi:hypothetical protein E4U42_004370 [Claviceps africana]|uniref:N-acetylgalactosaminide beta-1,3-galactosyltransferase n=1 Tax=Claviceps africana TaxID=83212 RepID=A0A8K0JC56_9HYPO|nr:hypothetical protein E4U42_004370 [Claviceps africana]